MADKAVEIKDGGQAGLMDPAGKDFQAMLETAKSAAIAKLEVKEDTSMIEDPLVKPAEPKDPLEPHDKLDEEPGDDVGNLKEQITGLKAELTKVRKQKSGSTEEVLSLKERLANMEGQLQAIHTAKTSGTVEEKLSKLSTDQVADNRIAWEDEQADARVAGRLAERDQDQAGVREANERIANARKMLKLYDTEKDRRVKADANNERLNLDDTKAVSTDLDKLFSEVYTQVPEMAVEGSDIWKAGKAEYDALPSLMKRLGPLGELVAAASAIAKHPELVSKKVTNKLVNAIDAAADKAFSKGGAAPTGSFKPVTTINSQADVASFEAQVRAVKGG